MTSIVLAADERYLPYTICSLAQLARFGRRADGVTVIVPSTVPESISDDLTAAAGRFGIDVDVIRTAGLAPLHVSGLLSDSGYISHFTYVKLFIAECLPNHDDVLYLDIDTLIRAPLDALLSWELRHPVGAVEELGMNSRRLFSTSRDPYFNAGVLRMSLERLRREGLWQQAQDLIRARPGLRFQDQDILNLLLRGRIDILPVTYNVFDSLTLVNRDLWSMRDPAIIHFAGRVKPWHEAAKSRFAVEWRRQYSEAGHSIEACLPNGMGTVATQSEKAAGDRSNRVVGVARRVLTAPVKRAAGSVMLKALDRTAGRLEETRTRLELGRTWHSPLAITDPAYEDAIAAGSDELRTAEDHDIDLLISLPHCGGELLAQSIHVANASPNGVRRRLIIVFPDHLNHRSLAELLRTVRPRLLMLRREMVFSFVAARHGTGDFSESAAADYVLHCDEWFDHALRWAGTLNLPWLSVTFSGLFVDGHDVSGLTSFYPDASFVLDPASGALHSNSAADDGRTDTSILRMVRSLNSLSTTTRTNLLRLPGTSFPE